MNLDISHISFLGLEGLFYVLLFFFGIQACILSYHWFTYGGSKHISLLAFAIYLIGGAILLLTMSLAMQLTP